MHVGRLLLLVHACIFTCGGHAFHVLPPSSPSCFAYKRRIVYAKRTLSDVLRSSVVRDTTRTARMTLPFAISKGVQACTGVEDDDVQAFLSNLPSRATLKSAADFGRRSVITFTLQHVSGQVVDDLQRLFFHVQ